MRAELEILRRARRDRRARRRALRAGRVRQRRGREGSAAARRLRAHPAAYVPIDISREQLARGRAELAADYPHVAVRPLCADYTAPLRLPDLPATRAARRVLPGSTIGNFHPTEAAAFLAACAARSATTARSCSASTAARTPRAERGVRRCGRRHRRVQSQHARAPQPRARRRLRPRALPASRLLQRRGEPRRDAPRERSTRRRCTSPASAFAFEAGETIWTESSYKYDRARSTRSCERGLPLARVWTDAQNGSGWRACRPRERLAFLVAYSAARAFVTRRRPRRYRRSAARAARDARERRRRPVPAAHRRSSASSAAGIAPDNMSRVSASASPATIGSPSPPAPMKAASVAAPTVITAAVLTPAMITGAASGRRTMNSR